MTVQRICSVDDCDRKHRRNGLCDMHEQRWRKYGRLELLAKPLRYCSVDGCGERYAANGYCSVHCQRVAKHGDPFVVLTSGARSAGPGNGNWRGTNIGYSAAHARVKRSRGGASQHGCLDCGAAATQWSYDHADPAEVFDSRGIAFSTDPAHYVPRCVRCHKRFDLELVS